MPNCAPTKDPSPIPFREKAEEKAPTSEGIPVVHVGRLAPKPIPYSNPFHIEIARSIPPSSTHLKFEEFLRNQFPAIRTGFSTLGIGLQVFNRDAIDRGEQSSTDVSVFFLS